MAELAGDLTGSLTADQVRTFIQPASQWHPFPQAAERDRWAALPAAVREDYIRVAEKYLHGSWPTPKATDFLGFVRTGNRSEYQAISYGRREQLATLVIAECIEGKGRFRDDIVNGIWTICERRTGEYRHLACSEGWPPDARPTVDLFVPRPDRCCLTYYL